MKRYRPKFDRIFWLVAIPTELLIGVVLALSVLGGPLAFVITLAVFLFTTYFFVSPWFGCVVLEEEEMLVRFGLIMKRRIPYAKIRSLKLERSFISYSMMSLKCALEHITVKYNAFDDVVVSVTENEELLLELRQRAGISL